MTLQNDPSVLYASPDGYQRVSHHYDRAMDSLGMLYERRYVETSFGLTHLVACGNPAGKPVALCHGQNANSTTWVRWIPSLARDYFIYAIDTIGGMGKSAATRPGRKGPAYGVWLSEVITALGLDQVNLIGASNGAWLILKMGTVAPELIGSAILLSPAGFMPIRIKLVIQMVSRSLDKDSRVVARRLVELLSPPGMPPDPFFLAFFELMLSSKFKGEPIAPRLKDDELRQFSAPVYLLLGEYESTFHPYKAIERALRFMPKVTRAEIVPGVGHMMVHEQPDWVTSRLTDFLEEYAR